MAPIGCHATGKGESVRKLEVTSPSAVRVALRHEAAHSAQVRFVHRLHSLLLVSTGRSCYEVAKAFGDDPRTVERWVREFQQHGIDGLKDRPHRGRPCALTDADMSQLSIAVEAAPRELGYASDLWSHQLLRQEVLRRCGLELSVRHCQRLLTRLGMSVRVVADSAASEPSRVDPPTDGVKPDSGARSV